MLSFVGGNQPSSIRTGCSVAPGATRLFARRICESQRRPVRRPARLQVARRVEPGGNRHTTRMNLWSKNGVCDRVFEQLLRERIVRIRIETVAPDSTIVKVHPEGTRR